MIVKIDSHTMGSTEVRAIGQDQGFEGCVSSLKWPLAHDEN